MNKPELLYYISQEMLKADILKGHELIRQDSLNQIRQVLEANYDYVAKAEVSQKELDEIEGEIDEVRVELKKFLDDPFYQGRQAALYDTMPPSDDLPTDPMNEIPSKY